jgi:iron complex transport system substrate-binding protein
MHHLFRPPGRLGGYRPLVVPLLFALVALLAACGGTEAPSTPGPTPAATPAQTAPAATATLVPTGTPEAAAFPRTISDAGGMEVRLEAAPERIISFSPGATEILFAIGAGDRVVATDKFSDFPQQVQALPKLEYSNPSPEQALELDPDVVIMATRQREQVEQFRGLGMTVLFLQEPATVEGVLEQVRLFGEITGNEEQAEALVAEMRGRIEAVQSKIADVEQSPRVYFELSSELFTAAPNSFVGDLLTLLKARNIAEGATSPFPQLTAEAVIEADPEVVLLANAEFGESAETVCARPGWSVTAACEEGRIHPVDPDLTNRPGPRVVDGLEQVARALYPERFE